MSATFSQRITNVLLAGIFIVLILNLWARTEHPAAADTFLIDNCITDKIKDIPKQYMHVVVHPLEEDSKK